MYKKFQKFYGLLIVNWVYAFKNIQELHLDLQTDISMNRTVILKCSGDKSNESWYLLKGKNLLIDDGSVNSEYILDGIKTNHTMHTMYIEFKDFSQNYLDVYKCVREKGATSNTLDLNYIFKIEPQVKCENVTAPREGSVTLQCTIKFDGITCGDNMNIYWENGITGEKIKTTKGQYKVECQDGVNDSFITTSLNIYTVTEDVTKAHYFMVFVNRHNTSKHCVAILNLDVLSVEESAFSWPTLVGVSAVFVALVILIVIWKVCKIKPVPNRGCSGNNDGLADHDHDEKSTFKSASNADEETTLFKEQHRRCKEDRYMKTSNNKRKKAVTF